MNTLLALSLLLAPAASPTPNPLAPAIAVYPDCAKDTDNARALACDYGVRLLSREPRKATVLFVSMWSGAQFNQPVVTSRDGLHIAPAVRRRESETVVVLEPIVPQPWFGNDPVSLAADLAVTGVSAGLDQIGYAEDRHQRAMNHKVWVALLRAVYERGNDDYSRAMLGALNAIDWSSPDSIDRFVAAHETALAADATRPAPAQPTPGP